MSAIGRAAPWLVGGIDPVAAAWEAAAISAGATYTTADVYALSDFIKQCRADGNWPSVNFCWFPLWGSDLTAAKITYVSGVWSAATVTAFVNADYTRTTGLTGNGTTKFLTSPTYSPAANLTANHTAMSVYVRAANATNQKYHMSSHNGASQDISIYFPYNTGTAGGEMYSDATSMDTGAVSAPYGLGSVIRTSSTRLDFYKNGSSIKNSTGAASGSMPTANPELFREVASAQFSAGPIALGWLGPDRDAAHEATFYAAVQAAQTYMGRQV